MPEPISEVKLVTVSLDPTNGLEVDWEGVSEYEAFGMLVKATEVVELFMECQEVDDDD